MSVQAPMQTVKSDEISILDQQITFTARTAASVLKLEIVGSAPTLGSWHLKNAVHLERGEISADGLTACWSSQPVLLTIDDLPVKYKYVGNGHRQSPTTRPLTWDAQARSMYDLPHNGLVVDVFDPTAEDSDAGWVTADGMGAFQLRVGQHPGSREPLVALAPHMVPRPFRVLLVEARAHDPAVPQGKAFAQVTLSDMGFQGSDASSLQDSVTFLMNGPNIEALAFRVDVVCEMYGTLLARGFVSALTLAPLQGAITCTLLAPDLTEAGLFRADFLVVTAADYLNNTLQGVQRTRWSPDLVAATLDIGHRGSGASKQEGRSVRENTILSFLKAATNHSDFVEFDVHVTRDGVVVVHHDFDVKLSVGNETLAMGVPSLTSQQLQSSEFTQYMSVSSAQQLHNIDALDAHRDQQQRTLKRNLSSGEHVFREHLNRTRTSVENGGAATVQEEPSSLRLSDRIATLREAIRRTPLWLGFNIELKFPTDAELASMTTRWYTRNFFVDAILKVVFDEAGDRKIIFSSFDPDCATLVRLKQPRYPVFFLTCAGAKVYSDPRMNSLEAALAFASSSQLQGVVSESSGLKERIREVVAEAHRAGLFLFTYGELNNDIPYYLAQKAAGVDAVIMDDVGRLTKASGKVSSAFNRPLRSPNSFRDVSVVETLSTSLDALAVGSPLSTVIAVPGFF